MNLNGDTGSDVASIRAGMHPDALPLRMDANAVFDWPYAGFNRPTWIFARLPKCGSLASRGLHGKPANALIQVNGNVHSCAMRSCSIRDGIESRRRRWQVLNATPELGWSLSRRKHDAIVGAAIAVRKHAADRMIAVHANPHRRGIPQLVADVEVDAFAQDQLPLAVHIDGLPGPALHRPGRVSQSRHLDPGRRRQLQSEIVGLANFGRKVTAGTGDA